MAEVLVTGAAGFLGSAVCREAIARGDTVTGLVRVGELVHSIPGVVYQEVDWNDREQIAREMSEAHANFVVHCAGATPRSGSDVASVYDANVRLVWELLAAIARSRTSPGVVIVSSAAVYGPTAPTPTAEDAPLAPVSHYGWSKTLAEAAARAFAVTENVRVCIARPFNVIGVGEPAGSVVSDVIEQLVFDSAVEVVRVREVASVRDFVDVDDVARALLLLVERGDPGEAYNVCGGQGTSIGRLVQTILDVWGSSARIAAGDSAGGGTISTGSLNKLSELGWAPASHMRDSVGRIRAALESDVVR